MNVHTQTHEDIVNSNINKKISESISASNPDKISADSSLNSIASIRLCKSNFLNDFRKQNLDRLIISHLNVNSLRNKFEFLVPLVKDNIDILMLSETKLDSSFPLAQFSIEGYSEPYRLDRDRNGGGLILFIRERLPSKLLSSKFNSGNKEMNLRKLVEMNLHKRKWLIVSLYNPHKTTISSSLKDIEKEIHCRHNMKALYP